MSLARSPNQSFSLQKHYLQASSNTENLARPATIPALSTTMANWRRFMRRMGAWWRSIPGGTITRYRAEYFHQDHLGNTRLVFSDFNLNGVVDLEKAYLFVQFVTTYRRTRPK